MLGKVVASGRRHSDNKQSDRYTGTFGEESPDDSRDNTRALTAHSRRDCRVGERPWTVGETPSGLRLLYSEVLLGLAPLRMMA